MKFLAKTGKLLIIFASGLLVLLFAASLLLQERVTSIVISSINKNITSRVEAEHVKLSFLRNFPDGSVELKNVLVTSPLNAGQVTGSFPDTLLFAQSFFLEFSPFDALRGVYNIKSIDVRSGIVNILTTPDGYVNYKVTSKRENTESAEPVNINLEKVTLSHIKATYTDLKRRVAINSEVRTGKVTSRILGERIDLKSEGILLINSFNASALKLNNPFDASVDLKMQSSDEGIRFDRSTFTIDGMTFSLEGSFDKQNNPDLSIKAVNVTISESMKFLPAGIVKKFSDYKTGGTLSVGCTIKGTSLGTTFNVDFMISNGFFNSGRSVINEITAKGNFFTDFEKKQVLDITDLSMKPGSSDIAGSFTVNDFTTYHVKAHLTGTILPSDIRDLLNYENISNAAGSARFDLKFDENISPDMTGTTFLLLNPEGTIELNSFSLALNEPGFEVSDANGLLILSDIIKAENLRFGYKGQKIAISGNFRNLPEWLAGKNVTLAAEGAIRFDRFLPDVFMAHEESPSNMAVRFPADMLLDFDFSADNVSYKNFTARDVNGSLNYKPRILNFTDLNMKSLDGIISGNGFIVQNSGKSIISKGDFNFSSIDVNKAFSTFSNFGQDFIIASNLSGIISGSVSVLLPMDSLFRTSARTITADGNYIIQNGALINFEPVKQLSDFIELSELENIHFQTIKNDFYIRNNILFIPQMDVRSSAADISVNGKHTFDNTYEYHVRVLLSQILSKKRKTIRKPITEFGAVQDDGLGRTSLLLKVESRGDDVKVGYDIKAVGNEVKQGIRKEKESLKTIMKEEYGWYSDDKNQQVPVDQTESKKKFTITWPENDSVPEENTITEEKPRTGLFRKR
ncbi:MAG TPA: AsmA-like C-terminal region-containing protein [Bacteroidales bacterium]|nr:AsmA-like C-terminal region-containing protein [Bacteroidales bacterium]